MIRSVAVLAVILGVVGCTGGDESSPTSTTGVRTEQSTDDEWQISTTASDEELATCSDFVDSVGLTDQSWEAPKPKSKGEAMVRCLYSSAATTTPPSSATLATCRAVETSKSASKPQREEAPVVMTRASSVVRVIRRYQPSTRRYSASATSAATDRT